MDIIVDIEYTSMETPPRCRKPRPILHEDKFTAHIRETTKEYAPEVMIVEQYKAEPMSIRHFDGDFYKEARLSHCKDDAMVEYPFSEIPWKRYLTPDFMSRHKKREEVVSEIEDTSNRFLIVDDVAYYKCGEPCYKIQTFGFSGCGTGVFLDYASNDDHTYKYSALDGSDCIKDAVRIAESRGDQRCVPGILAHDHVHINVLRPEYCTMKTKPHKFD